MDCDVPLLAPKAQEAVAQCLLVLFYQQRSALLMDFFFLLITLGVVVALVIYFTKKSTKPYLFINITVISTAGAIHGKIAVCIRSVRFC